MSQAYVTDFYAWTLHQADLLRNEEFGELDLPNLIEEIESMGKSQRREVTSRLTVLLMHLLKLRYQKRHHTHSWRSTIRTQRRELELVLRDSPTLRREVPDTIAYAYPRARTDAAEETGLPLTTFPTACPWTVEEILDLTWLPA